MTSSACDNCASSNCTPVAERTLPTFCLQWPDEFVFGDQCRARVLSPSLTVRFRGFVLRSPSPSVCVCVCAGMDGYPGGPLNGTMTRSSFSVFLCHCPMSRRSALFNGSFACKSGFELAGVWIRSCSPTSHLSLQVVLSRNASYYADCSRTDDVSFCRDAQLISHRRTEQRRKTQNFPKHHLMITEQCRMTYWNSSASHPAILG